MIDLLLENLESYRTEEGNNVLHISIQFNNCLVAKKVLEKGMIPPELTNA